MNIVCTICSDLLIPSSDVYNTPCGHIFHFQCLIKWLERSKTCPQCRERATEKSIHRIYFNFPNDDSIYQTDSVKLQDEINSLNFKLTLARKEITELKTSNNKLESLIGPLKLTIVQDEDTIKKNKSAILALKDQIQYYKNMCGDIVKKDNKIKMLNMKLEQLQSVQDILDASAHEVDHMIDTSYSDISKLQTFVSVLKRELENSITQKRQLREKVSAKSRAAAELLEVRSKLRQLEEILKNQNEEKANLQAKLLEMQTAACNSKCGKITAVEKKSRDDYKKYNSKIPSIETEYTSNSNNNETLEIEKDNDCIVTSMNDTENTPQNIKSRGFFSMTNRGIKRTSSNTVTVPSILAKKSMNSMNLNETDQLKKRTVGNGMTFDGFGGHAKYDKFPKLI